MNGPFIGELWLIEVNSSRKKMERQTSGMLIFAASHGRDDLVARLLEYQDVDVNERNRRGRTALFSAASKGHARVVELLLEREDMQVSSSQMLIGLEPLKPLLQVLVTNDTHLLYRLTCPTARAGLRSWARPTTGTRG